MSVQKRDGRWLVRWKEGARHRQRTFDRKRDAELFDAELRRRRQLGSLASLDAGTETLDEYVTGTWAPLYAALLAPTSQALYSLLYDHHISPSLGSMPLRELTPEMIGRWQTDRRAAGAGPEAVRKALTLLGGILQRALEAGRIDRNPRAARAQGAAIAEGRDPAARSRGRRADARRAEPARRDAPVDPRLHRAAARRGARAALGRRAREHAARGARRITRRGSRTPRPARIAPSGCWCCSRPICANGASGPVARATAR